MKKFLGFVLFIAIIVFLVLHFGFGFGFGLGKGDGDGKDSSNESVEDSKEEGQTIKIVVKQDQYFIEDAEVTIEQIKEKVTGENVAVIIENNYASTKAWDDIKKNLTDWGITAVEQ